MRKRKATHIMNRIIKKIWKGSFAFLQIFGQKKYMSYVKKYYSLNNVKFDGAGPKFIARDALLDTSGGNIMIGDGSVVASGSVILTHDYSVEVGLVAIGKEDADFEMVRVGDVSIGKNTFIGQRAILLPGVSVGDNCVIGAGCVVSRAVPDNSVVVGSPCKVIKNTKDWGNSLLSSDKIKKGNKRR